MLLYACSWAVAVIGIILAGLATIARRRQPPDGGRPDWPGRTRNAMKPTNAASIEAALQAAVIEFAKEHGRAAKAKRPSFRIVDAGTRNPVGNLPRCLAAALAAAFIVWGTCFTTLVVIDARGTSASAEWLATVIESAVVVAAIRSVTRGWRMRVIVTLFALAVGGTAAALCPATSPAAPIGTAADLLFS
jgi:hypothetical protein